MLCKIVKKIVMKGVGREKKAALAGWFNPENAGLQFLFIIWKRVYRNYAYEIICLWLTLLTTGIKLKKGNCGFPLCSP